MREMSTTRETASVITDAILAIVDEQGLERATVREVAAVAGVSIGTVQHHFPTKDAMLVAAFTEVVARVRVRLEDLARVEDGCGGAATVLRQILPLDRRRAQEASVQLAFATRAIHDPALAMIQRTVLTELHQALSASLAGAGRITPERARLTAHAVLALADGLALHALSTDHWLSEQRLSDTLELAVGMLDSDGPHP